MSRAPWLLAVSMIVGAIVLSTRTATAAPPRAEAGDHVRLSGRVRERGPTRAPVAGAVVLVVDAPADVRAGEPAEPPLDPEAVRWVMQTETDDEGRFRLDAVPRGPVRVVVVAGGYARLEQWAVAEPDAKPLELRLEPAGDGTYRTEVVTTRIRPALEVAPQRSLDAQRARGYPGSGDDPVLAVLNLPGVARSPGGLGLLALRGADPSALGVYVDGHPVPRAFHTLPIASVVTPALTDRVMIDPGNYPTQYGGFGGGLVRIDTRPGRREGMHGEAHLDLFDAGVTIEGPLGPGSVALGLRRSHVGDVLRLVPLEQLIGPNFWDYLGRFDVPLRGGHAIGMRALGAGDRALLDQYFDFRASFHRFDLDYRFGNARWQLLISPSLRLDRSKLESFAPARREAQVVSGRINARWQPSKRFALEFGSDVVVERWWRRQQNYTFDDNVVTLEPEQSSSGHNLRLGVYVAAPTLLGRVSVIPSLRANVFEYGAGPLLGVDPRVDLRGPVDGPLQLILRVGSYAAPVVAATEEPSNGYLTQGGNLADGYADIPEYLITYFDPNIAGDPIGEAVGLSHVAHGAAGFEAQLPWALELHALGFVRAASAVDFVHADDAAELAREHGGRRRGAGLELMLRRREGVIDGWIGYTLLMARVEQRGAWLPALFDQRHNLVMLLGLTLPRNIRVGLRFRLGSGNPERPITGRETVQGMDGVFWYRPIRGPRGASWQPVFHQLDIRVDKRWVLDRVEVGAYLDVQNVYNHAYPEVWIYSADWSARQAGLGLPIYPSLGVQVRY